MRRRWFLTLTLLHALALPCMAAMVFEVHCTGDQSTPPNLSLGVADGTFTLDDGGTQMAFSLSFVGLEGTTVAAHLHRVSTGTGAPIALGLNPPIGVFAGTCTGTLTGITPAMVTDMLADLYYVNIHTTAFPDGEIRGGLFLRSTTPGKRTTWGRIKASYR